MGGHLTHEKSDKQQLRRRYSLGWSGGAARGQRGAAAGVFCTHAAAAPHLFQVERRVGNVGRPLAFGIIARMDERNAGGGGGGDKSLSRSLSLSTHR